MSKNVWLKKERKKEIKKIVRDAIDRHKTAPAYRFKVDDGTKMNFKMTNTTSPTYTFSNGADLEMWHKENIYVFGVDSAKTIKCPLTGVTYTEADNGN